LEPATPDVLMRQHDPTVGAALRQPLLVGRAEPDRLAGMADSRPGHPDTLRENLRVDRFVEVEDRLLTPLRGGRARNESLPRCLGSRCHSRSRSPAEYRPP